MSSKIEQIIDEIEDFIENCRYQPLSSTKIIVNKEELMDLLSELRRKTPDEIKRYQKIISNKEAILADAQAKADAIIAQASEKTSRMTSEHEIMQQACSRANEVVDLATEKAEEILDNASTDAAEIRMGAIRYTENMLKDIENIVVHAMETTKARSDNLLIALQNCYDEINNNRSQLGPLEEYEEYEEEGYEEPSSEMEAEDQMSESENTDRMD